MQQEFYNIAFRKKIYSSLKELPINLDVWLYPYNTIRPHAGKYCYGKTPLKTFKDSKYIATKKTLTIYDRDQTT